MRVGLIWHLTFRGKGKGVEKHPDFNPVLVFRSPMLQHVLSFAALCIVAKRCNLPIVLIEVEYECGVDISIGIIYYPEVPLSPTNDRVKLGGIV